MKIIYIAVIGFSAEHGIRRYHALTAKSIQLQFILGQVNVYQNCNQSPMRSKFFNK